MDSKTKIETKFMKEALHEARIAYTEGEVPVGAVVVCDDRIIARAHNKVEVTKDASAHAELLAMREASRSVGRRLNRCVLYVTLEPCAMCMGAAMNFRIGGIVFGAFDSVAGCAFSCCELANGMTTGKIPCIGGVDADECSQLLSDFFKSKRQFN